MNDYTKAKAKYLKFLEGRMVDSEIAGLVSLVIQAADKEIARLNGAIQEMVNKAADKHLDGYRELGQKCATLENEIATKDAELARLREALEAEKENSLMAQSYAHDNGLYAARTGVQEVFVSPDGEILHELMEGEKPFCRIEYYEDSGDDSVGIPSVSFWTLAENQEGTELLDVIAIKSNDS